MLSCTFLPFSLQSLAESGKTLSVKTAAWCQSSFADKIKPGSLCADRWLVNNRYVCIACVSCCYVYKECNLAGFWFFVVKCLSKTTSLIEKLHWSLFQVTKHDVNSLFIRISMYLRV